MKRKRKLEVVITGIPQEWIGPVRVQELEEKKIPYFLRDGSFEIVLENPELATELLKKECHFLL
ncbi:hypothetical protein L6267_03375 [Candidatus Parcubacteria bacterium]|nr:hypothetical protein [Candidatus Parcubacteria bacterium]